VVAPALRPSTKREVRSNAVARLIYGDTGDMSRHDDDTAHNSQPPSIVSKKGKLSVIVIVTARIIRGSFGSVAI
jgi:hypothetical protein